MIKKGFIVSFFIALFFTACSQYPQLTGFNKYSIDKSIADRLMQARTQLAGRSYPNTAEAYWFFSTYDSVLEKEITQLGPQFLDTVRPIMLVPCDCMWKADTVTLRGGLAYGGGIGFDLKIVKGLFSAQTWIAGRGFRTDPSVAFVKEIVLDPGKQSLILESADSLRMGKTMLGMFTVESSEYYEEDESGMQKIYMKVFFKCKLHENIVL